MMSKVKVILENLKSITTAGQTRLGHAFGVISGGGFSFSHHKFEKLLNEGYASNSDVYSIINRIAITGAAIPYKVTNTKRNGEIEVITSGNFYDSIHQPNKNQNKIEFVGEALGYQLGSGNEIMYGSEAAGMGIISSVNVVPTPIIRTKVLGERFFGNDILYKALNRKGKLEPLTRELVKHIKYFNPTKKGVEEQMGLSPLQAAFQSLESSNEIMNASASAFKNRGSNGVISNNSNNPMDDTQSKSLQEVVNNKIGGSGNFNGIAATSANITYTPFGISPGDLKLVENGILPMRQLCNAYNADSSNFNDPDNKKFSNVQEGDKNFYTKAVIPPTNRHLEGYKELILPGWNKKDNANYNIELDLSKIEALQSDQNKRVEKQLKLSTGIMNILFRLGKGEISKESAIKTLEISFDMSNEEANEVVKNTGKNAEN